MRSAPNGELTARAAVADRPEDKEMLDLILCMQARRFDDQRAHLFALPDETAATSAGAGAAPRLLL